MDLMTQGPKNESNKKVRNYKVRPRKIVNRFLDMSETTSATAEAIYITLNEKISHLLDTVDP